MNCSISFQCFLTQWNIKDFSFCLFCNKWLHVCANTVINNIGLCGINVKSHPESMFISSKSDVFMISSLEGYTDTCRNVGQIPLDLQS